MKFYRPLGKMFILLTVIFSLCFSKIAIADEKPVQIPNAENVMAIIAVTGGAEAMDAAREADKMIMARKWQKSFGRR
jgi:hypothetical protein